MHYKKVIFSICVVIFMRYLQYDGVMDWLHILRGSLHIHNIPWIYIVMGFVVERDVNRLNHSTSVSIIFSLLESFLFFRPSHTLVKPFSNSSF